MITIIQGCGSNITSLQFALNRLGVDAQLSNNAKQLQRASHIILPGVGSAENAMKTLQQYQLINVIRDLKQPVLGICLGMQLFFDSSEEGNTDCLGIIPGRIKQLIATKNRVVPHMGWNQLSTKKTCPLLKAISDSDYFYFVHSYVAPIAENTITTTHYGELFSTLVQKDNFFGVQFHPERSGEVGACILKNFMEL